MTQSNTPTPIVPPSQPTENLASENATLKKQLETYTNQLHNFMAQLDAHKQALNEAIQTNLSLRTNMNLLQKQLQDSNNKVQVLEKQIATK